MSEPSHNESENNKESIRHGKHKPVLKKFDYRTCLVFLGIVFGTLIIIVSIGLGICVYVGTMWGYGIEYSFSRITREEYDTRSTNIINFFLSFVGVGILVLIISWIIYVKKPKK